MNVLKILLFLTVSITTSCAQQTPQQAVQSPKKTPQISFKIEGYTEGVAQLIGVYADANYLADSAKIATDGSFQFVKPEGYFDGFFYVMLPDQTNFQVLVANGEKGIIRAKRGDILNTLQVEQSLENKLFYENQRFQMGLEQRFNAVAAEMKKSMPGSPKLDSLRAVQQNLLKEREGILTDLKEKYPNAFFTKFKLAGQNPKYRFVYLPNGSMDSIETMNNYRDDWWIGFDFSEDRLARTPVFLNKLKKYMTELTVQSPEMVVKSATNIIDKTLQNKELFKVAANWITYNNKPMVSKMMDCDAVYAQLVLKYFTLENATNLGVSPEDINSMRQTANGMLPSFVGKVGQDVAAQDKNKQTKSIYGLKSLITVVFIYNPDCDHCQEQTPKLREVYDKWKSKGIEVFSIVANAKDRTEWQNFSQKYGINWTDVWDTSNQFVQKYYVDNTPEMYVLDKNHIIVAKNLKAHQLPEVFERELAKLK